MTNRFAISTHPPALAPITGPPTPCQLTFFDLGVIYRATLDQAVETVQINCSGGTGQNECLNNIAIVSWFKLNPTTHVYDEIEHDCIGMGPYSCNAIYTLTSSYDHLKRDYGTGGFKVSIGVFLGTCAAPGGFLWGTQDTFTVT